MIGQTNDQTLHPVNWLAEFVVRGDSVSRAWLAGAARAPTPVETDP